MRGNRLGGVHVHRRHEPARLVGTDWQQGNIWRTQPGADRRPMRTGPAIAGEEHPALVSGGLQHEAAPERSIAIKRCACGEMPGWRRRDAQASNHDVLPPIQLSRLDPMPGQDLGIAEQGHDMRVMAALDLAQARQVHVVVVVMRQQDQVRARQVG